MSGVKIKNQVNTKKQDGKMSRDDMMSVYDNKHFLFGLFFSIGNRLQTAADAFYEEITCKQFFLSICVGLFQDSHPTINELADVFGSSHQNVKQIINKMEKNGYLKTYIDPDDKRKTRVCGTTKLEELGMKYNEKADQFLNSLYEGIKEEDLEITCRTVAAIDKNLIKMGGKYESNRSI